MRHLTGSVKALMLLLSLTLSGGATANAFLSASDLLAQCESAEVADRDSCRFFVAAVSDTINVFVDSGPRKRLRRFYRLPMKSVTDHQLTEVVVEGLN
jgi:hypothetical protein